MQTKKQLFYEIIRFLVVGAVATLADYLFFYVLRFWILPADLLTWGGWDILSLALSTAVGFGAGLLINWILSVKFVFRNARKVDVRSKKDFSLFAVIGIIGLLLTEVGVLALTAVFSEMTVFGVQEFLGLPWEEWIAKVIMTCVVLVFNYLGRKILIFKTR